MIRTTTRITRLGIAALFGAMALTGHNAVAQDSATCPLDPITLPLFDATPPAVVAATPLANEGGATMSDEDAFAAVQVIVDCANEADPALAWAIFTERYLAEQYSDPAVTNLPAFEQFIAESDTRAPGSLELVDVSAVTPLDDGRVSVEVTVASGATSFTNTLVLAQVGEHWLIDDVEDAA